MSSRTLVRSLVVACVVAFAVAGVVQAADPLIGTWKLNPGMSKFSGPMRPTSTTVTYAAAGEGLKVTVDAEMADGARHWEYTVSFDGKEMPVTGNPDADSVSTKRISPTTTESIFNKGGKAATTNRRVVSADGKTLTITIKGTSAKGEAIDNTLVFEKQS